MGKTAADTQPRGKSHERFGCGLAWALENRSKLNICPPPAIEFLRGEFGSRTKCSVVGYLPVPCTVARSEIWFPSRLAFWVLENLVKIEYLVVEIEFLERNFGRSWEIEGHRFSKVLNS